MEKGLVTQDVLYDTFHAMGLKEDLLRGIYAYGYKKPSMVQQRGIVPFSKGLDLILQGMKGPGRTSTYCIGILQQLDIVLQKCQCLILAFSIGQVREIVAKIEELGKYLGVKVYACVDKGDNLSTDSHVVVGTLEHVHKLVTKQMLYSKEIKTLVLDEAQFLMYFNNRELQVNEIIKYLPLKDGNQLQICAFSETLSTNILKSITKKMRYNPMVLLAKSDFEKLTLDGIKKHKFLNVETQDFKGNALREIIDKIGDVPIVVFVESSTKLLSLSQEMERYAYTCSVTRACMDQTDIDKITKEFLEKTHVLLTTCFWSRGIVENSFHQVRFVVNYDISAGAIEEYLWTLGWFWGVDSAISFATRDDWDNLIDLQGTYDIIFENFVPSQSSTDFPQASTISINKDPLIKHFLCNAADEEGKVYRLLAEKGGLYKELVTAVTSVIFVNSSEKLSWLVDKMKLDDKYIVLTANDNLVQVVDATRPCVFITTDQKFDVKVKVHFVINFDIPLTYDDYYRRLGWCQSNAIFLIFGTKMDWLEIFNLQALYGVFVTWIPRNSTDILEQMVLTETSSPISKKVRTMMH